MDNELKNCLEFLDEGLSPFHAVKAAADRLERAGYTALGEGDVWRLAPGGRYYTTRNGSSVIAWRMPADGLRGWRGTCSHSDSPTFRVAKADADGAGYGKTRIEEYGGPRWTTWVDRPLRVAGRLFVRTEDGIAPVLVATDALLVIPTLCCHFDREGRFGAKLNMSADMQPISGAPGTAAKADGAGPAPDAAYADAPEGLLDAVKAAADLPESAEIVDFDLVLALNEDATVIGPNEDLYLSSRIDDLASAATTLDGFLRAGEEAEGGDCCDVWAMFDNEEVGSQTRQGAAGSFLPDVMARIEAVYGLNAEDSVRAKANAFFLSVDNGHATHPNHPEKSDPAHPIALNGGVVVKVTANQKYTTTAMTAALFREICRRANVPTQVFYNRPDVIGGGTLGNILSRAVSVPMADIGLPQLSMHSAMETAGTKDVAFMVRAVKAFYETRLAQTADGTWTIG